MSKKQLPLGRLVATPGAIEALQKNEQNPIDLLKRHANGDWGTVCRRDWATNDLALKHGERVLSSYKLKDDTSVWIITEWDRSVTTILLPEDY